MILKGERPGFFILFCCWLILGGRHLAGVSFLFVPEKEAKRVRRFDAAAADQGCALDPYAATPPGRPTQALGGLSKEWI